MTFFHTQHPFVSLFLTMTVMLMKPWGRQSLHPLGDVWTSTPSGSCGLSVPLACQRPWEGGEPSLSFHISLDIQLMHPLPCRVASKVASGDTALMRDQHLSPCRDEGARFESQEAPMTKEAVFRLTRVEKPFESRSSH